MQEYIVDGVLDHDGKRYNTGDHIVLSEAQAKPLLGIERVKPAEVTAEPSIPPPAAPPTYPKLVDGIRFEFDGSEPDGSIVAVDHATFQNLQESPAGFGKTEEEALANLRQQQAQVASQQTPAVTGATAPPATFPGGQPAGVVGQPGAPAPTNPTQAQIDQDMAGLESRSSQTPPMG